MAAPTLEFDQPFYVRGDKITAKVIYDPLSVKFTAVAPNGEKTTVPVVFKVAFTADVTVTLTRVSDDGHTAVFTGVF